MIYYRGKGTIMFTTIIITFSLLSFKASYLLSVWWDYTQMKTMIQRCVEVPQHRNFKVCFSVSASVGLLLLETLKNCTHINETVIMVRKIKMIV